jgi:hypothetical protein
MNTPIYEYIGPITEYRYQFTSLSTEKEVTKVVRFTPTTADMVYNLALFDQLSDGGESNDKTETRNKDMDKVLATVLGIIINFLHVNPFWFVYIEGSDNKRKRLYQILVNREYDRLKDNYLVFGGNGIEMESFEKGKSYEFFLIAKQ